MMGTEKKDEQRKQHKDFLPPRLNNQCLGRPPPQVSSAILQSSAWDECLRLEG